MAKVDYISPVDALHGKLKNEDTVGYARMSKGNGEGVRTKFTQSYGTRDVKAHPYTELEVNQHTKFGTVATMVNARIKALSPTDTAAFAASKFKTLRKYLWSVCGAEYDAAQAAAADNE